MIKLLRDALWPYLSEYKAKMWGSILLSIVLAAIGGLQVKLVQPLVDSALQQGRSFNDALYFALLLMGLGLINFPCRFFHFYWIRYVVDRATCNVRTDIFRKFQSLPTSFFAKSKQGSLISNVVNDTQIFSEGFKAIVDLIREPLKAMTYLGMAFYSDWMLSLVVIAIAPFWIVIFSISGKRVRRNQNAVQEDIAELTHTIAEGMSAHKITKAFNLQNFVLGRFNYAQELYFRSKMKTTFVEEFAHPLVEVVGAMAFAGVVLVAWYRAQQGMTTGDFISFAAAMALFMDPIRKFSQANVKLSQARAAADRIFSLLKLEEEVNNGTLTPPHFEREIEVKNLTFSYGEGNVIKGLNLSVKKGQKIALVGLSGSGKSTLINLLLGLYPIEQGEILIDGNPIKSLTLHSLRNLFGLVSQDIFLFNDSIKNNLMLGEDFTSDEISRALDVAYASEFVNKLPDGVDTMIGDRGTRLSGGQQQRITIARAFLQDTEILLFDEATSALDNESEKVVQKALEHIAGHKTVIAVAHRLSTIQDYDQIYVMHEGHLVEQGTHSELMARGGEYAKLYELSQKA